MAGKLTRVEIRIGDRIHYAKDVEAVETKLESGVLTLTAIEPGSETTEAPDNPLLPPPPQPGAPDGHDDTPSKAKQAVLERVHTGEDYASLATGAHVKALADDEALPDGAIEVTDLVFGEDDA